jgi:hypothetical protein
MASPSPASTGVTTVSDTVAAKVRVAQPLAGGGPPERPGPPRSTPAAHRFLILDRWLFKLAGDTPEHANAVVDKTPI